MFCKVHFVLLVIVFDMGATPRCFKFPLSFPQWPILGMFNLKYKKCVLQVALAGFQAITASPNTQTTHNYFLSPFHSLKKKIKRVWWKGENRWYWSDVRNSDKRNGSVDRSYDNPVNICSSHFWHHSTQSGPACPAEITFPKTPFNSTFIIWSKSDPFTLMYIGSDLILGHIVYHTTECNVSVLKFLGFKTCPFFNGFGIRIEEIWYQKKCWIRFRSDFGYLVWRFGFETSQFQNFSIF